MKHNRGLLGYHTMLQDIDDRFFDDKKGDLSTEGLLSGGY